MSKKSRKKSPKRSRKSSAAKAASVRSPKPSKARAAKSARPTRAASKKAAAPPRRQESQRAASKPLKRAASAASRAAPVAEGTRAPAFHLPRDGGESVSLSDFAGRKLVVFFYPRADTPGCTREAIDFTRLSGEFDHADTVVLGVSADPPRAQEAFRNKHQLAIPLISDEKHGMLEAYGAWGEKSLYGRTFMGIIRTTVLIGKDGRVARIWRNVRVDGHADEVLAAALAL